MRLIGRFLNEPNEKCRMLLLLLLLLLLLRES